MNDAAKPALFGCTLQSVSDSPSPTTNNFPPVFGLAMPAAAPAFGYPPWAARSTALSPADLLPLKQVHERHRCDVCYAEPIVGVRYKCANCPDYDLCERCEQRSEIVHSPRHVFLKIKQPTAFAFKKTLLPSLY